MTRTSAFQRDELLHAPIPTFAHRTEVRFQDVDGAAIVFFGRFFEYFHDAYAAFLGHHGIALAEVVRSGAWLAPLTHAEADFVSPLRFGDHALVEIVRAALGDTSLRVGYRIVRVKGDHRMVCALGQTVHVMVDRQSFRPRSVPEEVRQAFASLL